MSHRDDCGRATSVRQWRWLVVCLVLVSASAMGLLARPGLPEVGQEVPDFTLPVLDGEALTLSERSAEGPVVLVFFRGAW
jgi:hypothetical protein